jgi:opacity protein-like surface antigen
LRILAIALALSSTVLPAPAIAREGAWYVGGDVGAVMADDTDVDVGAVDNAVTLNHDIGYDAALFVGHDFGAFRVEAEAGYRTANLGGFETLIRLPGEGPVFPPSRDSAQGSTRALSFMVNGMVDIGDDDGVSGFIGGGVGYALLNYKNHAVFANTAAFFDASESGFAWQLLAGARLPVSSTIDLTARYRYFSTSSGGGMVAFNGTEMDSRFSSHSLLFGITFNFGGQGSQ